MCEEKKDMQRCIVDINRFTQGGMYVVFERTFSCYHENNTQITCITHLYYQKITPTRTLKCTLECDEKLNSLFALEHRYLS